MHTYLVVYDVSTEDKQGQARPRKVARVCLDYGRRVQKSVFECTLEKNEFQSLVDRLLRCIDPELDSLRIYKFTVPIEKHLHAFGIQSPAMSDPDEVIII